MKTMHRTLGLSLLALGCLLAVPAASMAKGPDGTMATLDPDKDGTLDWNEVKAAAEAKFDRLEKDKDGTLDWHEVRKLHLTKAEFHKADPDKDGTLDKTEYLGIVEKRFKAANRDHDETLDAKELHSRAGRALLSLIR